MSGRRSGGTGGAEENARPEGEADEPEARKRMRGRRMRRMNRRRGRECAAGAALG